MIYFTNAKMFAEIFMLSRTQEHNDKRQAKSVRWQSATSLKPDKYNKLLLKIVQVLRKRNYRRIKNLCFTVILFHTVPNQIFEEITRLKKQSNYGMTAFAFPIKLPIQLYCCASNYKAYVLVQVRINLKASYQLYVKFFFIQESRSKKAVLLKYEKLYY